MSVITRVRQRFKRSLVRAAGVLLYREDDVRKVFEFFRGYDGRRTLQACSAETGLSPSRCRRIKKYLYRIRRIGAYCFPVDELHTLMRERIEHRFAFVNEATRILEVGPGGNPLFPPETYPGWWGVDKFAYSGIAGAKSDDAGPDRRKLEGSWEDLSAAFQGRGLEGTFDLVAASASFEHVSRPIRSLVEAGKMLRPGGGLAVFVPDGRCDDPTMRGSADHTIYVVPQMVEEFFEHAGGFVNVAVESFRHNCDCFISAERAG